MTFKQYTAGALRTESTLCPLAPEVEDRGLSNRLYHAILGLCTEMHEVYDAIELKDPNTWDNVNLLEEWGDSMWYLAIAADELKITNQINDFKVEQIDQITLCNPMSKYIFIKNLRQLQAGLLDTCKKVMFYGKQLDLEVVKENIFTQYLMIKGIIELISQDPETIDSVMHINLAKLKQRYPEKFDGYKAEIRDLDAERKILEKI